jgi:hypothetical protein
MDGPWIDSWWGDIIHTRPERSCGHPSLLYTRNRVSFRDVKRPGCGVNHPLPYSAEVKERVELYLYSPSGPSRAVLRLNFPLSLYIYIYIYIYVCVCVYIYLFVYITGTQVAGTRIVHTFVHFNLDNFTLLQHCFHVKIYISIYI